MIEQLQEAKDAKRLISAYVNPVDVSAFDVGFVLQGNEDFTTLSMIDENGQMDSVAVYRTHCIRMISWDSLYVKRLSALAANSIPLALSRPIAPRSFSEIFEISIGESRSLEILTFSDTSYATRALFCDEQIVSLDRYDENGFADGSLVIKIEDVYGVRIDGVAERSLDHLIEMRLR